MKLIRSSAARSFCKSMTTACGTWSKLGGMNGCLHKPKSQMLARKPMSPMNPMKTNGFIFILALSLNIAGHAGVAQDLSTPLQEALFEEEANRDLPAAIQAYQAVLADYEQQRKLAATAAFRLGECYRKMGRTNDALVQYQRVLREFSDQTALVQSSREQLGLAGAVAERLPSQGQPTLASVEEATAIRQIQTMIKESPDLINAKTSPAGYAEAPLHRAARNGQLLVVRFLLENNADVNVRDSQGSTPLGVAVNSGNKSMVELLLEHGADVGAQDSQQRTPLHVAAQRGFNAITEVLLAHGADVNTRGGLDVTPLQVAAESGYRNVVETLLDHGAKVNSSSSAGVTALMLATAQGQLAVAELLLKRGASVQAADNYAVTALHRAVGAKANRAELLRLLLASGADVNAQDRDGGTPLHYAVQNGDDESIRLILEEKPKLELRNSAGMTPLMQAVRSGAPGIVPYTLLLEAGASPNEAFVDGYALLHYAVGTLRPELVELLLAHGANPNVTDRNGDTPLSTAKSLAASNDPKKAALGRDMAQLLLQHGADENLQRRGLIMVRRGTWTQPVFYRGTNSYNYYSLFELLAAVYSDPEMAKELPFPDFAKLKIRHMPEPAPPAEDVAGLASPGEARWDPLDCTADRPLAWGDVVEIPEADHKLNEVWAGLPNEVWEVLKKCLQRKVRLIVGGESSEFTLQPSFATAPYGGGRHVTRPPITPPARPRPGVIPPRPFPERSLRSPPLQQQSPGQSPGSPVPELLGCRLKAVLSGSNMLRTSSDLSRVKVTRPNPDTGQTVEMLFDLSDESSYDERTDLWLRDGDVIEVP